ncbi:hypothetical protein C8R43DRAFT_273599 [Mycena crocata]|nr:hypothetical protein C8R43DRAFT_273599 [Mycena crocata]
MYPTILLIICFLCFLCGQVFNAFCTNLSAPSNTSTTVHVHVDSGFTVSTLILVVISVLVIHDILLALVCYHLFKTPKVAARRVVKYFLKAADGLNMQRSDTALALVAVPRTVTGGTPNLCREMVLWRSRSCRSSATRMHILGAVVSSLRLVSIVNNGAIRNKASYTWLARSLGAATEARVFTIPLLLEYNSASLPVVPSHTAHNTWIGFSILRSLGKAARSLVIPRAAFQSPVTAALVVYRDPLSPFRTVAQYSFGFCYLPGLRLRRILGRDILKNMALVTASRTRYSQTAKIEAPDNAHTTVVETCPSSKDCKSEDGADVKKFNPTPATVHSEPQPAPAPVRTSLLPLLRHLSVAASLRKCYVQSNDNVCHASIVEVIEDDDTHTLCTGSSASGSIKGKESDREFEDGSDWDIPSYEDFVDDAPPEPLFEKKYVCLDYIVHRPPLLSMVATRTGVKSVSKTRVSRLPLLARLSFRRVDPFFS